jgi:hypothetical protein
MAPDVATVLARLADPKADTRRVQEWMGHADVSTTMRCLHYVERPDEVELVAEAFAVEPELAAAG